MATMCSSDFRACAKPRRHKVWHLSNLNFKIEKVPTSNSDNVWTISETFIEISCEGKLVIKQPFYGMWTLLNK